ncbi:hypothetical protein PSACC_03741 [Paramicrosporidium saccamoebae]|uniref:Uncharacterized protein n=1 Tax=Paramicrosporidium saccamoebae TaxID=1246581 RepID=A0A2H9TF93_9FUNG|nr:hypothetical protein PSACC_03741 [Paramicrosporidium saccamoebae]
MTGDNNNVTLNDIKQRLSKLEIFEAEMRRPVSSAPVLSGFARRPSKVHEEDSQVRAKIMEVLNGPGLADSMVPNGGSNELHRAVFIKSNGSDIGAKLSILEEEEIQKTAVMESPMETVSITLPEIPALRMPSPESPKNPQAVRKFQSWFSYFYSGKSSGSCSPVEAPLSPMEIDEPESHSVLRFRPRQPRSILKKPPPLGDMSLIPPPIQKSTFLRHEEVQRLSRFVQRHSTEERRRSGFARHRKLRFDLDRTDYGETWNRHDYERGGVEYIAKSLTPDIAMMIKRELNEVKKEMPVHEESKQYTQFYMLR